MVQKTTGYRFMSWEVIYQYDYPVGYGEVMQGNAQWSGPVINILGYYGKFVTLWDYHTIDTAHPKCYYCGKFVKAGTWWKDRYSGNCTDCYEELNAYY